MFCTHCGTKIDEGKKFCRTCGAQTTRESEPVPPSPAPEPDPTPAAVPIETPTRSRPTPVYDPVTRPSPVASAEAGRGINKSVFVAAGIVIIAVGVGAGIYFGTDLLRQPVKQETAPVEGPVAKTTEAPVPAPVEEAKISNEVTDSNVTPTVQPPPAEPLPAPVEAPKPQPEVTSKTPPKTNTETYARKAPSPPPVQNPPASTPVARPPAPAIASRGPADPGTYQIIRATTVFEEPSASSRIVASIGSGIKVNVVGSNGDWLEVRSKHGKPPGFIRRDDAALIERTR